MVSRILELLGLMALAYILTGFLASLFVSYAANDFDPIITVLVTLLWPLLILAWVANLEEK